MDVAVSRRDGRGDRMVGEMPRAAGRYGGLAILFVLPLLLRIVLGSLLPGERVLGTFQPGAVVHDPAFLAMAMTALAVLTAFFRFGIGALGRVFQAPVLWFLLYGVLATGYALFSQAWLYGAWVGFELLVYLLIAALLIEVGARDPVASAAGLERVFFYLILALAAVAVVDMILPATDPFELTGGRNRFRGTLIVMEQNQWSAIMGAGVLLAVGRLLGRRGSRLVNAMALLMAGVVFVSAGSRAGLGGWAIGMAALLYTLRRKVPRGALAVVVLAVMAAVPAAVLVGIGKTETAVRYVTRTGDVGNVGRLGGRLDLWAEATEKLIARPWMGYGIGAKGTAFWESGTLHNFVLEAWRSSGLLGGILFVVGVVQTGILLLSRWRLAAETGREVFVVAGAVFLFIVIHSLTESSIAGVNSSIHIVFWFTVVMSHLAREYRRSGYRTEDPHSP